MQRRSFVPRAALVTAALAVALTACTSGSGSEGADADHKSGEAGAPAQTAAPGRYQSLPEPCGLPDQGTLRAMLPGDTPDPSPSADQSAAPETEKVYEGKADVTYDTDRRVGCRWTRETSQGTRHLTVDFHRVVSYDPSVSDEAKAQEVYSKKELAAGIPSGSAAPPSPTASPDEDKGGKKDEDGDGGAKPQGGADAATQKPGTDGTDDDATAGKGDDKPSPSASTGAQPGASSTPDAPTGPRVLEDLGNAAYLDDELVTTDSGVHRDITVVLRSSNVIVTITYDQWSADKRNLPASRELQEKAQELAQELVDRISE
ncbi:hypothetical protein [Streptomyces sp. NPDC003077]|uniref:hypothetical protein n=1 Tax=Streptomyces sp. NPDC003077 TaxID=3154443 RepID=UPI00339F6398